MLDSFLQTARPRPIPVELNGATYYVRPLTGAGREQYVALLKDKEAFSIPAIVLFGLCDAGGTLLGDPFNAADREKIKQADGDLLQRLADVLLEASGLVDKSAREAEKKSEPSPTGLSGTG